jgi:hypothetical protein
MLRRLVKHGLDARISLDGLVVTIHGDLEEPTAMKVACMSGVELL